MEWLGHLVADAERAFEEAAAVLGQERLDFGEARHAMAERDCQPARVPGGIKHRRGPRQRATEAKKAA